MSEPQHPYGTDTNAGRPAPGETPPAAQAAPDSVAAVGARLAQLRESKGWTIEDVSARLKVAVPKLRAIEAGDLSRLPDTTFVLGVVRSYAKMLGADPAPFTQALRRERGLPQPDLSMPAASGTDLPRGKVSLSLGNSGMPRRRSWLWGVAAVIVAVIALAMWHTNGGESSAWLARLKATANGAAGTAQNASAANVAEGQTTGGAQDAASAPQGDEQAAQAGGDQGNAQEAAADTAAQQPASAAPAAVAQQQAPAQPAQAMQQAAPAVQQAASAAAPATTAARPQPASAPAVAATQPADADTSTFAIRVTQDTWVSVRQKDGKEVFSGLVHGSDAREISGVAPLKITVGNKAGIESMTLDGQPVDATKYASARGNVARFMLP
ncbi:helix-turn-helix domain-containing protein [Paraburkholderia caballeronis]|uniref:Cytoskeleton protein RodZ n=1 Tax=Paraburkholderia caballeronis TaxID=416943 RepID=A0A1H7N6J4_9BURK|nr:helix-turn-helix domain-containing protein [Paraburkholderia caballeronis]PXW26254.1 cytoskeleton protein RodZ [Paraburkholderia caballeronis]PXX01801.1 cytoskeleton protein RodZ [Paraburkholderia caballeronis]RAK00958.1 cytoskeleton protein RodZ [Paraburkholderia caballeronis]SEC05905.1 cytoskeleton protein RodZ [Paraburkholderia caballeronis]SEL18929.1 cytoskeleton protein RodZ [Paraburkholderia caballeronis]